MPPKRVMTKGTRSDHSTTPLRVAFVVMCVLLPPEGGGLLEGKLRAEKTGDEPFGRLELFLS